MSGSGSFYAAGAVVAELLGIHGVVSGLNPGGDIFKPFVDRSANAGFHYIGLVPAL